MLDVVAELAGELLRRNLALVRVHGYPSTSHHTVHLRNETLIDPEEVVTDVQPSPAEIENRADVIGATS